LPPPSSDVKNGVFKAIEGVFGEAGGIQTGFAESFTEKKYIIPKKVIKNIDIN
jgi:hypothetical protein